jgi:hypothetical protein
MGKKFPLYDFLDVHTTLVAAQITTQVFFTDLVPDQRQIVNVLTANRRQIWKRVGHKLETIWHSSGEDLALIWRRLVL